MTTTTFDLLGTTLLGLLAVRAIVRRSGGAVLAAGVVVGIGVEAKPQIGLVAAVMAATVIVVGPRMLIRSRWAARGGVLRRRAGRSVCDLAAAARLAAVDRRQPYCGQSGGWSRGLFSVPVGAGQPGARTGLDRGAARSVSPCRMARSALHLDHLRRDGRSSTSLATATRTTSRASTRSCSVSARYPPPGGRSGRRDAPGLLAVATALSAVSAPLLRCPCYPSATSKGAS